MTDRLKDPLDRLEASITDLAGMLKASGSSNVNTMRIEGAGSIWHGLAVGIALGAVIIGGAWIVSVQQRIEMIAEQSKAYSSAVYMLAPRFASEIDKELDRQKERNSDKPHPRDYAAAPEAETGGERR